MKKHHLKSIAAFAMVAVLCLLSLAAGFGAETENRLRESVIDLKHWDFEKQGIYKLTGFWEFYPNRIILEKDFAAENNLGVKQLVEMPRAFYSQQKFEDKYDSHYGTLRTTIKIPSRYIGHKMALRSTLFYMNAVVYADGQELIRSQDISRLNALSERLTPNLMAAFTPRDESVELIIHFTQRDNYGNAYGNIVFGLSEQVQDHVIRRLMVDTFLFSTLLILGIFNLGFFMRVNQRKTGERLALYFGLLVLVMAVRLVNSGEHYLLYLLPMLPGELFSKLSYWSYYLLLPMFVLFACEVRKDMLPPIIRQLSLYIATFFGLFVLMGGHELYEKLVPLYYGYFVFIVIQLVLHIVRSIRLRTEWLKTEFISFLLMSAIFILDSLYIMGYYEVRNHYQVSLLLFACYVTYKVAKSYSSSVDQLENLIYEHDKLAAETQQIEQQYATNLREKQESFESLLGQREIRLSALEKIAKEFAGTLVILDRQLKIVSVYGVGKDKHFGSDYIGEKFVKYFLSEHSESGQLFTDILSRVAQMDAPGRAATYLSLLPKTAFKQGRWYELQVSQLQLSKEDEQHFVVVINDVTKFTQTKQQVSQAQKDIRLLKSYAKYEKEMKYLIYRVAQFTKEELELMIAQSHTVDELIDRLIMGLERFAIWYEAMGFDKTYSKFRKFILELDRLQKEAVPIQFEELVQIIRLSQLDEFDAEDRKMIREHIGKELRPGREDLEKLQSASQDLIELFDVIRPYSEVLADRYGKTIEPIKIEGPAIQISLKKMGPILRALSRIFDAIIVHNIEYYDERTKANKPLAGHIEVVVSRDMSDLIIEIRDDGAGINVNTLKDSLYKLNLLSFKEIVNATDEEVLPYIFEEGVYYRESDNDFYGIGDGLWLVKKALAAVNGTVEVASKYQSFCQFTVRLPIEEVSP